MIYLFDKDEKLIKIVRKSAVKTALQKYALTTERYVSDRLTVELKGLNADELEQIEYMAIQTMEDAHTFHYFYVAQKFSDSLTMLIGVQSGIEELRKSPIFDKRPQNAFAREVVDDLLAGTNWQARFVGETTPHSTNFYYTSVFDALKKVCEVWDLEMQFFVEMNGNRIGGRYIDFKQRIGEAVGKRVVYGHNALQILQEVERTNIFTALIGRGKGEETSEGYGRKITFENVVWSTTQGKPVNKPAGQKYLELPLMTRQYGIKNTDGSMRPKIGFVDFSEEENPEILIERTYRALVDAARPQLTLKTSSVYLRGVKVGDTIRVVRHDKKLDYDTRIFEITFNRLNNQSSDIKLGDRIGESNEAKAQKIADKAVEQFVNNEFSNFVQNLPDYLPSADGFNNNWYGAEDPTVQYPGKVLINDIWYKPDLEHEGHKIMLRWTGEVWEEILRTYDSEALRDRIAEEIAQVNTSMQAQSEEHNRQVVDILSKTQSVEELANQAKTDAASALARANQVKTEAIADARAQVATVSQALSTAKTDLQNQVNAVDAKAVKVQSDANALRTDFNLQAGKILEQAQAQTALTNRVTTVETLADGTRSTVAELSKTVSKATGDITSVTSRTKTVEDTLSQTRTQYEALTQTVNTQTGQIDSINRKTADLQSGIDGVTERFENLRVGQKNLILNSDKMPFKSSGDGTLIAENDYFVFTSTGFASNSYAGVTWDLSINSIKAGEEFSLLLPVYLDSSVANDAGLSLDIKNHKLNLAIFNKSITGQSDKWFDFAVTFKVNRDLVLDGKSFYLYFTKNGKMRFKKPILVSGNVIPSDWSPADEDTAQQIAEYKRTAEENYSGLQSTVSTLDGKVTQNKTEANQTATQLSNRLTSLETYKDGESTRVQAYFEASKTETAKQLTAERTVIASNYVAKSIYDEDARGTTLKLNEIKTTADTAKQNLATYQNTVDRKLEELTSSTQTLDGKINTTSVKVDTVAGQIRTEISEVEGKIANAGDLANYTTKTEFQTVKETTSLYERVIGSTEANVKDKIARIVMADSLFMTEVKNKVDGTSTQVTQLSDSYAIKNLTSSGTVLNQLNLNKDGSIKIDGSLVQITGTTYIQDGVISSAKIANLDAGKINTGALNAARIAVNSIDGSKLVFDQAFVNKMTANEAYLKQIFAKNAFITSVQAVAISASQISSGIIKATNGAMLIDLDNALTEYKEQATIRFHSAGNVLYREKTHPKGHKTIGALMFKDSNGGGVMTAIGNTSHQTIDTMRNNYGEGGLTGSFAGIRVVRDDADTQRDRVDIIADRIIMAHSTNLQEPTNSGFYFYPTAVRGWWNLGAILQNISNKFEEHGWGKIGNIYHLGYTGETSPSQYT